MRRGKAFQESEGFHVTTPCILSPTLNRHFHAHSVPPVVTPGSITLGRSSVRLIPPSASRPTPRSRRAVPVVVPVVPSRRRGPVVVPRSVVRAVVVPSRRRTSVIPSVCGGGGFGRLDRSVTMSLTLTEGHKGEKRDAKRGPTSVVSVRVTASSIVVSSVLTYQRTRRRGQQGCERRQQRERKMTHRRIASRRAWGRRVAHTCRPCTTWEEEVLGGRPWEDRSIVQE